jgi:hypothetical protein
MLASTHYTVSDTLLQQAILEIPEFETSIDLNYRTGNFFYDQWLVSDRFENTVWEEILNSLPTDIGQARLIKLKPEECYRSHADIDDRYHLSIISDNAYLVDLDDNAMYPTVVDGRWYLMDAGKRHSAINFSGQTRIQLVTRQLLISGKIENPQTVKLSLEKHIPNFRYVFDDTLSPWLNKINKQGQLNNFQMISESDVSFVIDKGCVSELVNICPSEFKITL